VDAADLCYTPALDLGRMIRARQVSPVEIVTAVLERLDRLNPTLNAFLTPTPDFAMAQARAAEARAMSGEMLGPMDGIPVSIKDLEPMAGVRCTFGSKWSEDNIATEDGVATERLRNGGAVILGKTNTPHFGYCQIPVGNPRS
jgi:Asp-tRNA(Asn)/Glu-tRNA(Gln) amidotransferase A subunit family amidase